MNPVIGIEPWHQYDRQKQITVEQAEDKFSERVCFELGVKDWKNVTAVHSKLN